ncbi:hypothetical protein QQZ08_005268 [Neonectria magnoliae]|uniref:DNA2/NAM7 helicase-like C-terminal domain-containing protein n=1 Tax=Neonectria magnoliae TaxID=2732573 RepID=A0ABR1I3U7_9HYPO
MSQSTTEADNAPRRGTESESPAAIDEATSTPTAAVSVPVAVSASASASASAPSNPPAVPGSTVASKNWDGFILGGKTLGVETVIDVNLRSFRAPDTNSWMGFQLMFPRGKNNENDGFGQCHEFVLSGSKGKQAAPSDTLTITVKFLCGGFEYSIGEVPEPLRERLTGDKLATLHISLKPGSRVTIEGYGLPFSNAQVPCDGWLNHNSAITGDETLLNFLEQKEFMLVVPVFPKILENLWSASLTLMPEPIVYPYGDQHFWDVTRYNDMQQDMKGKQFAPALTFDDDNSHVAVLTQSVVQDVMWVARDAAEIFATKFRAYFVCFKQDLDLNTDYEFPSRYLAVVPLTQEFRERYESAWGRLTNKGSSLILVSHDGMQHIDTPELHDPREWPDMVNAAATWDADIMEYPAGIDELQTHDLGEYDLVLYVCRRPPPKARKGALLPPVPTFKTRDAAKAAFQDWDAVSLFLDPQLSDSKRKVGAVFCFDSKALPTNPVALGICTEGEKYDGSWTDRPIPDQVKFNMSLHRDLVRGTGFYNTMRHSAESADTGTPTAEGLLTALGSMYLESDVGTPVPMRLRPLPVVNLLAVDLSYRDALMEEVNPVDRPRFIEYMTYAKLGLGIMTAGPGFGKTTLMAVAALGMTESFRKLYASAPTHVAVDNFAARIDRVSSRVVDRYNQGKSVDDPTRARGKIVVRGYRPDDELRAFRKLLENPTDGDISVFSTSGGKSKWKLNLSLAYWLLMVLGSPAVRGLGPDDSPALHRAHNGIKSARHLAKLRGVATGAIPYADFKGDVEASDKSLIGMLKRILHSADIVCTTASLSSKNPYMDWKEDVAQCIAVDEAANMQRPDLLTVWGNTLLPCMLGGDDKQLQPAVMTVDEKDGAGNYLNRHPGDGQMSPLLFFKANGWPVFRLRTQFRMATGLFDLCHREVYADLPFEYGPGCKVDLPQHAIGVALESFLKSTYPGLTSPLAGTMEPVFFHCEGTRCIRDKATRSKMNPGQVKVALDFLVDFVKTAKVDPSKVVIISPYKANVAVIERMRKKQSAYSVLESMEEAATIDSFQGREGDIVVVIMGTTQAVGPGFTTDVNRLNVMLSRQKSGLVIFGDIDVLAGRGKGKDKGKGKGKAKAKGKAVQVLGNDGQTHFLTAVMLQRVYQGFSEKGRMITISASKQIKLVPSRVIII